MKNIKKTRKKAIALIAAFCIISVAVIGSYVLYHHLFTPDTVFFAGAYPFEETELNPDYVILNISDSDFEQYPVLRELVSDPEGGHITFSHFEWDYDEIQEFRDIYCVKREVNRYVFWNDTYYQIVIGQS
ncbi:hypothetical protein [Methanoplanus limicola]|uniref:Uncharacterized protein n=1 Tax=Methanoplanus limicola DSM 2279 TaxID=937775 RepID=H1Z4L5_9EURY|nr:hypothetical protein [Methanoplanus limicola]EHQ36763.1 hypothetical protein Metlim_2727 [Methanoplanus limicola DSM 2279]